MSLSAPAPDAATARTIAQREIGTLPELVRQLQGHAKADRFARGQATVTWPGGSPIATVLAVAHGLRAAPSGVQLTAISSTGNVHATLDAAPGATSFSIRVRTVDGSSPAAGVTATVLWEARA